MHGGEGVQPVAGGDLVGTSEGLWGAARFDVTSWKRVQFRLTPPPGPPFLLGDDHRHGCTGIPQRLQHNAIQLKEGGMR